MKKILLSGLLCLATVANIFAGTETLTSRLQGTMLDNTPTLIVQDDKFSQFPNPSNFVVKQVTNTVVLGIDQSANLFEGSLGYTLSVVVEIAYKDETLSLINMGTKTLTINYDPSNSYTDKDVITFLGGHHVEVKVISITKDGNPIATPSNIYLESNMEIERYYSFDSQAIPSTADLMFPPMDPDSKELVVNWARIDGAEEYDLEWTWVNNYNGTVGGIIPPLNLSYSFKNNATRVRVKNTQYTVPLVYESGWILFRYRAIGRHNVVLDAPLEGTWSTKVNEFPNVDEYPSNNKRQVSKHNDDNINWQYSATFAEGGKRSTAVSYYDGTLRNRQSVAKLNTEDKVIVGSVIYDHQGRPAVNVLPAPFIEPLGTTDPSGKQLSGYIPDLNKINTSFNFTKLDFDVDQLGGLCIAPLTKMDKTASKGAAKYYSDANPEKEGAQAFLPDANGYPFVQTEYTNDQTGRVRRQGGLGEEHQLSTNDHETKYFYGQPEQPELDVLFGSEVGAASHYKKNAVVDANGQVSVSYIDMHDRVVATALAGQSPNELIDIASYSSVPGPMSSDLIAFNTPSVNNKAMEVTRDILVTNAGDYTFNYSFSTETFTDCLPGGNTIISSSYEYDDVNIFTDNRHINMLRSAPDPVYADIRSIYQDNATSVLGPVINKVVYPNDVINSTSVQAYYQSGTGSLSGSLVRFLEDDNGDLLYYDNAGSQPTLEHVAGNTVANQWGQIQMANNITIAAQYYYLNGTPVNLAATDIHLVVYTRVNTGEAPTWFDNINIEIFNGSNPSGFCFDCVYELTISVKDECGIELIPGGEVTEVVGNISPFDVVCDGPITFPSAPAPLIVNLPKVGTYSIYKSLKVSDDAYEYYKQQFIENNTCGKSYQDILEDQIAATDFSGCDIDPCEFESFLVYEDEATYITANGPGTPHYADWKTKFINDCEHDIVDPCAQMLEALENDFYPGGQYARYDYDGQGNIIKTSDEFSIFRASTTPYSAVTNMKRYESITNWGGILVTLLNGNQKAPNLLTVAEFVFYFDPTWIPYMVELHPEYCNYEFCSSNQAAYDFIEEFKMTNNFVEACSKGFLDPLNMNPGELASCTSLGEVDPNSLPSFKANMLAHLNDVGGSGLNAWQVAIGATACNHETTSAGVNNCIALFSIGKGGCDDIEVWNVFKAIYIAKWIELMDDKRCIASISTGKVRVIPLISEILKDPQLPGNPTPVGTQMTPTQANAALIAQATSVCEGYADSWMTSLAGCGVSLTGAETWAPSDPMAMPPIYNPTYDGIRQGFIDVCVGGSVDITVYPPISLNAMGAITSPVPVSIDNNITMTTFPASNFDEVIVGFGLPIMSTTCTSSLISPPFSSELSIIDDCGCNKILQAEYEFVNAAPGTLPLWINNAADYLMHTDGIAVQNFEKLSCECTESFGAGWDYNSSLNVGDYWNSNQVNPILPKEIYVNPALTCETCIICEMYTPLVQNFHDDNLSLVSAPNYNQLLTNYLNNQFNVNFTSADYDAFTLDCNNAAAVSCNVGDLMAGLFSELGHQDFFKNYTSYSGGTATLDIMLGSSPSFLELFIPIIQEQCNGNYSPLDVVQFSIVVINQTTGEYRIDIETPNTNTCPFSTCSIDVDFNPDLFDLKTFEYVGFAEICGTNTFTGFGGGKTTSGGWEHFTLTGSSTCFEFCECADDKLCTAPIEPEEPIIDPCVAMLMDQAAYNAQLIYDQYINEAVAQFEANYYNKCLQATELFDVAYESNEHHYTLYYYDQAGNLTKTVPPKGVDKLSSLPGTPIHTLVTTYQYNAYNQVIEQTTPDGGTTHYWYDKIGRLVASQNKKQNQTQLYSYTIYDVHGRIVEVGQIETKTEMDDEIAKDQSELDNWYNAISNKTQVTKTIYDAELSTAIAAEFGASGQQNLRNRIASVIFQETYNTSALIYDNAIHYSYDEHGNVITSVQDNVDLIAVQNQFKRTDYTYELISGNILEVAYQKGKADQFFHKYDYDADNRLAEVFTSKDAILWDRDAKYKYYQHGPLARVETGDLQVQGTDYTYTIQGWLKGVNSNTLSEKRDMGKDGNTSTSYPYMNNPPTQHAVTARDAFGYSLNYFDGDYTDISNIAPSDHFLTYANTGDFASRTKKNLYNGNITAMTNAITKPDGTMMDVMGYAYQYDQLNRLRHMDAYTETGTGTDIIMTNNFDNATANGDYQVNLTYDANGNITDLNRNAYIASSNIDMDQMEYNYLAGTNQLDFVTDNVSNSPFNDIKEGQLSGNYEYTEIGELKKDVSEQIKLIEWTVYGKVKKVTRTSDPVLSPATKPSDLEFIYGPSGQRVVKIEKPRTNAGTLKNQEFWKYTYYSYDASGNLMATYDKEYQEIAPEEILKVLLKLNEHPIYGSARLGLSNESLELFEQEFEIEGHNANQNFRITDGGEGPAVVADLDPDHTARVLGKKMYELTNHLGNVQVVISDRKRAVEKTGSTGIIDYYTSDVVSASDYYPFGMLMPGRNFSSSSYRFGFNGMEMDNEVKGSTGSSYTTYFRQYDPRLGRWMTLDPKKNIMPYISPYAAMENNPIVFNDPKGDCPTCLSGAVLGILTELTVSVGSGMLSGKTFIQSMKDVKVSDLVFEGIAGAFTGAIDGGVSRFVKFAVNPRYRKVLGKMVQLGLEFMEELIKTIGKQVVGGEFEFSMDSFKGSLKEAGIGTFAKNVSPMKKMKIIENKDLKGARNVLKKAEKKLERRTKQGFNNLSKEIKNVATAKKNIGVQHRAKLVQDVVKKGSKKVVKETVKKTLDIFTQKRTSQHNKEGDITGVKIEKFKNGTKISEEVVATPKF